jgi:hypothetical protein
MTVRELIEALQAHDPNAEVAASSGGSGAFPVRSVVEGEEDPEFPGVKQVLLVK